MATHSHQRQRKKIITRQYIKFWTTKMNHVAHLLDGSGSFFNTDNIFYFGEPGQGIGINIDACSARNVIHNNRNRYRFCNRLIMLIQSLLGRPVIIGTNHQGSICTGFIGMPGQPDSFCGTVGTGPGNHRHPLFRRVDHDFNHPVMFIMGRSR